MNKDTRATFAIISHPDAGKTTMTEKLLWFGGVIREAGMVKSKSGDFATSDWMELEKERGISVTSSVMSFHHAKRAVHLLDTPGHKDFSEDTYRTLTAVESVLMMIDSAKGVETQTKKLMEVCRMRDTPIITFMNKFDRESRDPFELIDDVEKTCSIQCIPMTWPIGEGVDFKGVYDRQTKNIKIFGDKKNPLNPTIIDASNLDSDKCRNHIGDELLKKLKNDLEMVDELIPSFEPDEYLAGIQTPVYFGSALHNFGVKEVLDAITQFAPGPLPRQAIRPPFTAECPPEKIAADYPKFSGFIFKIQANMDKRHRDRVAFMRVCTGTFKRNSKIFHVRSGKELKIASPLIFQAQSREITEVAYAGDIIGLHDTGKFQIGDTFTEGEKFQYIGIPNFAPEIFMKVLLKDPLKAKQLEKGLTQLGQEGTVQLFRPLHGPDRILGAVGMLQFDVVKFRLDSEYGAKGDYQSLTCAGIRWLKFPNEKATDDFLKTNGNNIWLDVKDRYCFWMRSPWDLKLVMEKNPDVQFYKNSDYIKPESISGM